MNAETYIIAVRRDRRGEEPADWQERVSHISGIQILSTHSSRLQVRASEEAIDELRSHWGHLFHIEKQIAHAPKSALAFTDE